MGPIHGSLHAQARKLAQSGGNRNRPPLAAMPRQEKNSRPSHPAAGSSRLESSLQPRPHQNQLEVHPQSRAAQVRIQKEIFQTVIELGPSVCVENMDKRKPGGRSVGELARIFAELPDATFCFDIGHARQFNPTMTEAWLILKEFGSKLRQVHVSEVNTRSKHDRLSYASILA